LGAFAGAASAQTNVTIYGLVDAAVTRADLNPALDPALRLDSSGQFNKNGSRIGFRGTEDLGGGISGIFTLENGFGVDDGTLQQGGRLFGRQAFVGLQGAFGAVKIGRQYSPMHLALDSVDPFGTGMAGNIENPGMFGAVIRTDNTINFSTSAAGLNGQVAYSFGERAGDTTSGRQVAAGLGYANGPINVQFAWHNAKADPLITPAPTTAAAIAAAGSDVKTTLLGAVYNLGVAKVHAAFQLNKSEIDATGVENRKDRNYMLGLSAPIGAGEVRASVLRSDSRIGAGEEADQYAVGYVHNLSKRTNVYTSYARILSDRADVLDGNVFNVGVQHKF